jgi:hypothetical protein
VLGIDADAAHRRIEWTVRLTCRHGIENLSLGSLGQVDLLCEARQSAQAPARVSIVARGPVDVIVRCAGREVKLTPPPAHRTVATV